MRKKVFAYGGFFVAIAFYIIAITFVRMRFSDTQDLISEISKLYGLYGYYLVFFGALVESVFLLGLYVPGSAVVLFGAAISKTGALEFPLVLLLGISGLTLGYIVNYLLGRHGWYHVLSQMGLERGIKEAEKRIVAHRNKTFFLGYFNPASASFISTASGVLKIPFQTFLMLSICAQFSWALLWGSLAYFFGLALVEIFIKYFGYVVVGLVIVWIIRNQRKKN